MTTRYIIKGTYQRGARAGESIYITKSGHIVEPWSEVLAHDTYSLSECKKICKRYAHVKYEPCAVEYGEGFLRP